MGTARRALWYIESHFAENPSLAAIASVVGVSPFHLSRLFQLSTGTSVVRYLRGRRLTEAARQLAAGASDILRVAIAAGYASHAAFTRAFSEQFGRSPEQVRAQGLAGLTLADAPDLERYDTRFDDRSGHGGVEIWLPLTDTLHLKESDPCE